MGIGSFVCAEIEAGMTMSVVSEIWMGLGSAEVGGMTACADVEAGMTMWVVSEIWIGFGSVTLEVGVVRDIAVWGMKFWIGFGGVGVTGEKNISG
jgi:hypothetical protein